MRLCIATPGRSSSGGAAFGDQLTAEVARLIPQPPELVDMPVTGRIDFGTVRPTHLICIGSRAGRIPGARTVFWPLNVAPFERHVLHDRPASLRARARHLALRRRIGLSAGLADGLVFGSNHAKSLHLAAYVAAAKKPYTVIRGGTPSLPIAPAPWTGRPFRSILVVSHLYPYKGILEFVDAIGSIAPDLPPDVRVRVAGADRDATYAAAVHARVADLGLGDRVVIKAATPAELSELYRSADLAVFPSTCENAGSFALYDGLHTGCPTLCSDRSSMPEMVTGAVEFVNPFDTARTGHAILRLVRDDAARQRLHEQALVWSAAAPTWAVRAQQLVAFLQELDGAA